MHPGCSPLASRLQSHASRPGSIYVTECSDCTFVLGARQVRLHTSSGCDFYLHVASHPIVERCDGLRFAPYPALPAPLAGAVAAAGVDHVFKSRPNMANANAPLLAVLGFYLTALYCAYCTYYAQYGTMAPAAAQ